MKLRSSPYGGDPQSPHAPNHQDRDWEPIAADDARALVPPGEYEVVCTGAERRFYPFFGRHVVVLSLRIFDGPYIGTILERFYNVRADGRIGRGSHYWREWVIANQGVVPRRRERMAMRKFCGKLFRADVVTVEMGRDGTALAHAEYSKVARLLELVVSNEAVNPQA